MDISNQGSINIYIPQGSIYFNGSNQYGKLGYDPHLDTNDSFSVGVRMKTTNSTASNRVIASEVSNITSWLIQLNSNNNVIFLVQSATGVPCGVTSNSTYNDGNWHDIVGMWDSDSNYTYLYIDGNLIGSNYNDITRAIPGAITWIARRSSGYYFPGYIREFIYWSGQILNQMDILMYHNGIIPKYNKIGTYHEFREKIGDKFYDTGPYNITGNLYNSPEWKDNSIRCWCNRWDRDNYLHTLEVILNTSDRNYLTRNITPGAVKDLFTILGETTYIDTTYASSNTLVVEPISGYAVSSLRSYTKIGVKNVSDNFINKDLFKVKIEGYIIE